MSYSKEPVVKLSEKNNFQAYLTMMVNVNQAFGWYLHKKNYPYLSFNKLLEIRNSKFPEYPFSKSTMEYLKIMFKKNTSIDSSVSMKYENMRFIISKIGNIEYLLSNKDKKITMEEFNNIRNRNKGVFNKGIKEKSEQKKSLRSNVYDKFRSTYGDSFALKIKRNMDEYMKDEEYNSSDLADDIKDYGKESDYFSSHFFKNAFKDLTTRENLMTIIENESKSFSNK